MKLEAGKQFYQLVVVAWLTFSLGSVLLALLSWHQLTAQMEIGRQTVAIRDDLNGIFKSLLDLETGERGYVITGNKQFLEPFNQAETNLPVAIQSVGGAGSQRSGHAANRHEVAARKRKRA